MRNKTEEILCDSLALAKVSMATKLRILLRLEMEVGYIYQPIRIDQSVINIGGFEEYARAFHSSSGLVFSGGFTSSSTSFVVTLFLI